MDLERFCEILKSIKIMIPLRFCACATMQNDTLWLLVPGFCKISLLSLVNSSTRLRISFEKKTVPWIRARQPLNPDFLFLTFLIYFWNEISSQFFSNQEPTLSKGLQSWWFVEAASSGSTLGLVYFNRRLKYIGTSHMCFTQLW